MSAMVDYNQEYYLNVDVYINRIGNIKIVAKNLTYL